MTTEEPGYYSRQQLAERAGVSYNTFVRHEAADVGNIKAAREKIKGLGLVYVSHKCRKYLSLIAAAYKGRKKPTQSEEAA